MAGPSKHTHKYHLIEGNLWACGDCTHYLPKNVASMIYTRFSRCWECDRIVKMTDPIMDFAKINNNGRILCEVHIERTKKILAGVDVDLQEALEGAKAAIEQIDKGDIKL